MQGGGRGRGRTDYFDYGYLFAGYPNFTHPRSLFSRTSNPFDDLFFNHPFGTMFTPCQHHIGNGGFLQTHPSVSNRPTHPIIEELVSDDEEGGDSRPTKVVKHHTSELKNLQRRRARST